MKNNNKTLSIYGIQDIGDNNYPNIIHDHSFSIMKNGKITNFIQLERITRKKYDNKLYSEIIPLLKYKKLFKNLSYNYIFVDSSIGRNFISTCGNLRFEAPLNNFLSKKIEKGFCLLFGEPANGYALNHELAHLYSCIPFFGKFKENSLLIHFDGGASKSNFSVWEFVNNKLNIIEYHWDLKLITSFFNSNALVFYIVNTKKENQNSVPGKLMGLSAYGNYSLEIENWLKSNNYFNNIWGKPKLFFNQLKEDMNISLNSFDTKNKLIQNIAATFQYVFQRELINKIKLLKQKTKTDYLYYTGGSALNICTNTKIVNSLDFKGVYIPPCPNDAGLSVGAGCCLEMEMNNTILKHTPYLNNYNIEEYETNYSFNDIKQTASLLLDHKIIGVCNGYGEIGPRALGNRSIIALASSKQLSKKINEKIKKREWFRPLAPIMLEKNTKYFTGLKKINLLSKYMLLEFNILPELIHQIEGATHINNTARIQTIYNKNDNPFIFDLLTFLDENYSIKALINTSFNKNGEPIVHTIEDATKSGKKMGLDALVLNGKLKKC